MQPLDKGLNVAIIQIASRLFPAGFDVSDDAPSTYKDLCAHLDAGNRMLVFKGGSDHTIYSSPEVNWALRAWHDWCHWRGHHDLTTDGERAVCDMQMQHLRELDGSQAERWGRIIRAEIVGQAEYYRLHKRFPDDQRGFAEAYMSCPAAALLWPLW